MTLTVRLDAATESALDRYCAERGVTKSRVVQESLAVYLLTSAPRTDAASATGPDAGKPRPSANYRAFAEAGLIGGVALGGGADKSAVRARMAERFAQQKARRGNG